VRTIKSLSPNIEKLITSLHSILPRLQRFFWNSNSSKEKEALGDLHCLLQGELDSLVDTYTLQCGPIPAPKAYVEYETIREMVEYARDQAFYARCDNRGMMASVDSIYNIIMHAKYKLENTNGEEETEEETEESCESYYPL
jgi:hypothetical protein